MWHGKVELINWVTPVFLTQMKERDNPLPQSSVCSRLQKALAGQKPSHTEAYPPMSPAGNSFLRTECEAATI